MKKRTKDVLAWVFLIIGLGFGVLLVLSIFNDYFFPKFDWKPGDPTAYTCTQDSDCVPASCCHPTDAVNKDNAPDCSGTMCTMNCEPNTLDCGQGEIKCVKNECIVFLK